MQPAVADKFAAMLEKDPEDAKAKLLRDTYNEGLSHPNEEDFANFKKVGRRLYPLIDRHIKHTAWIRMAVKCRMIGLPDHPAFFMLKL